MFYILVFFDLGDEFHEIDATEQIHLRKIAVSVRIESGSWEGLQKRKSVNGTAAQAFFSSTGSLVCSGVANNDIFD